MRKAIKNALMILTNAVLLAGCAAVYEDPLFKAGVRNIALESGEPLFTTASPKGIWEYYETWKQEGYFKINGASPFAAVAYSARLALGSVMEVNETHQKKFLWMLKAGQYDKSVEKRLKEFYTEKHNQIVGLSSVSGSVVEVANFTCTRFEEVQDYGPPSPGQRWSSLMRVLSSSISCPVVVEGELWEFYYSYRISIANEKFYETYGAAAPTDATLIRDIEERLRPMLEEIEFHRPVSQNYNELDESIRQWYESASDNGQ